MKELLDHIDENDQVIGTTDKVTAHATGQRHRIVAVFVFDSRGNLYVQVHRRDGKWDHSVGGHVQKGETYAQAAIREADEELGIRQPLTELATGISGEEYPNEQHLFGLYTCIADPDWKFVPNDEVNQILAMSIPEIVQKMQTEPETHFTRGFRITMKKYLELQQATE